MKIFIYNGHPWELSLWRDSMIDTAFVYADYIGLGWKFETACMHGATTQPFISHHEIE